MVTLSPPMRDLHQQLSFTTALLNELGHKKPAGVASLHDIQVIDVKIHPVFTQLRTPFPKMHTGFAEQ